MMETTKQNLSLFTHFRQDWKWLVGLLLISVVIIAMLTDLAFGTIYLSDTDTFWQPGSIRAIIYLTLFLDCLRNGYRLAALIAERYSMLGLLGALITPIVIILFVFLGHERWVVVETFNNNATSNQLLLIGAFLVFLVTIEWRLVLIIRTLFFKSSY